MSAKESLNKRVCFSPKVTSLLPRLHVRRFSANAIDPLFSFVRSFFSPFCWHPSHSPLVLFILSLVSSSICLLSSLWSRIYLTSAHSVPIHRPPMTQLSKTKLKIVLKRAQSDADSEAHFLLGSHSDFLAHQALSKLDEGAVRASSAPSSL